MNRCDYCCLDIDGTPYAFPLNLVRFEEWLRFCSEGCLEAYQEQHTDEDDAVATQAGGPGNASE